MGLDSSKLRWQLIYLHYVKTKTPGNCHFSGTIVQIYCYYFFHTIKTESATASFFEDTNVYVVHRLRARSGDLREKYVPDPKDTRGTVLPENRTQHMQTLVHF